MKSILRPVSLLALVTLTACGSIPTRDFEFDAMDVGENPRPCMVVINDDWVGAEARKQFVNVTSDDVLTLNIAFPSPSVEVTMAPMLMINGQPKVPKSRKEARDSSGFMEDVRRVERTDPKRVLFILPRKPVNS